jgi:hypothetical protein
MASAGVPPTGYDGTILTWAADTRLELERRQRREREQVAEASGPPL